MRLNKRGIGLAEILVAVALLGMASVLLMNMLNGYLDSKTKAEFNHITKNFGLNLSRALGNPATCGATLTAANMSSLDLRTFPSINKIIDVTGATIYQVGNTYSEGTLKLLGIRIQKFTPGAGPDRIAEATVYFDIEYLKDTPVSPVMTWAYHANVRTPDPLVVTPDAEFFIEQVGAVGSEKAICSSGVTDRGYTQTNGDTMIGPLAIDLPASYGPIVAGDPCFIFPIPPTGCIGTNPWFGAVVAPLLPDESDQTVPPTIPWKKRWGLLVNFGYVETNKLYLDSDERLKQNIQKIKAPLELLNHLEGRSFSWKDSNLSDWGFIAQDVKKFAPELVHAGEKTGYLSVQYLSLLAHQVEALKLLKGEQDDRALELSQLKERMSKLRAQMLLN